MLRHQVGKDDQLEGLGQDCQVCHAIFYSSKPLPRSINYEWLKQQGI